MFNDPPVQTIATIQEILGDALYRAALPNGKTVVAHLSKALTLQQATFQPGNRVHVELTPYDFDAARITGLED